MVAPKVLLDGYIALGARFRDLIDFILRLLVFSFALASGLEFFASLVLVPISLAGNTMLAFAFLTAKDRLIRTTWVYLTRVAGGGETVSEIWVCCKGCFDTCLLIS